MKNTMHQRSKIIAMEFDGVIVENRYPEIGSPMPFVWDALSLLQKEHYILVLWTNRQGVLLNQALNFCEANGVVFHEINHSFAQEAYNPKTQSRKINAHYFIDARNVGGFIGWGRVYQWITSQSTAKKSHKSLWHRILGK